jgi:sulfopyruvate decarboxylase TPP-binding subunit
MGYSEDACAAVTQGLDAIGIEFLIHVPGSPGAPVISHFKGNPKVQSFPVAREEDGIGIASGLAMTGKKGVLLCQDGGLGNSVVALTTLVTAYHVPMLVLAIRPGGSGEFSGAVHTSSETTAGMVETLKIRALVLDCRVPFDQWPGVIQQADDYAHLTRRPTVVFVSLQE